MITCVVITRTSYIWCRVRISLFENLVSYRLFLPCLFSYSRDLQAWTNEKVTGKLFFVEAAGFQGIDIAVRSPGPKVKKSILNKILFQKEFDRGSHLSPESKAKLGLSAYHQIEQEAAAEIEAEALKKRKAPGEEEEEESAPPAKRRRRSSLSQSQRRLLESKMSPEDLEVFENLQE